MALVITGTLLTFQMSLDVIERGTIFIDDHGRIESIVRRRPRSVIGFDRAPRITWDGVVVPGLIDLHGHASKAVFPIWEPCAAPFFEDRDDWLASPCYQAQIAHPAVELRERMPSAVLRFAEVRAALAGTTTLQGSLHEGIKPDQPILRHASLDPAGPPPTVFRSLDSETIERVGAAVRGPVICHLAEGRTDRARAEVERIEQLGLLSRRLVAIHGLCLDAKDFHRWARMGAGALVWSPLSNLWLYGSTTDVLAARTAGILLCLGADWSVSGSKNLLGELKVADAVNRLMLGGALQDEELCRMVTVNPARALAWDAVGKLSPGARADLLLLPRRSSPWRSIIDATERDVALTIVNGRPVAGRVPLLRAASTVPTDVVVVAGVRRGIVLPKTAPRWADMVARLQAALRAMSPPPTQMCGGRRHRPYRVDALAHGSDFVASLSRGNRLPPQLLAAVTQAYSFLSNRSSQLQSWQSPSKT